MKLSVVILTRKIFKLSIHEVEDYLFTVNEIMIPLYNNVTIETNITSLIQAEE